MLMFVRFVLLFLSFWIFCPSLLAAPKKIHVLVWSEGSEPKNIYPKGINGAIADALKKQPDMDVSTADFKTPELGLSPDKLDHVDVLIWFGHKKHEQIPDETVEYIVKRVKERGMGFIALHSSHFSKPFKKLLNTSGAWADYKETGEPEKMEIIAPNHPIVKNVRPFTIRHTEVFVEPFQVPQPDDIVIEGVWSNKHKSREVMTWTVGKGRLVYIRAGHESYPIYFMPKMQKIIINSVRWVSNKD